jgi:amino acid permease
MSRLSHSAGETSSLLGTSSRLQDTFSSSSSDHHHHSRHHNHHHGSASAAETIINEAKTCMGTGCLALPYAARVGGVLLHISGLFAIGLWNIYAVHRLCQCLALLPKEVILLDDENADSDNDDEEKKGTTMLTINNQNNINNKGNDDDDDEHPSPEEASHTELELSPSPPPCFHHRPHSGDHLNSSTGYKGKDSLPLRHDGKQQQTSHQQQQSSVSATASSKNYQQQQQRLPPPPPPPPSSKEHFSIPQSLPPQPPQGTSTYSRVAWYAFGPLGLYTLDIMMACLFIGVVVAFVDACRGFLRDTPFTSGHDMIDALAIALVIGPMSAVPDMGYLSKASATGLLVLFLSFLVISGYGVMEYFFDQNTDKNYYSFNDGIAVEQDSSNNNPNSHTSTAISDVDGWNWLPPLGIQGVSSWFGCVVFGYGIAPLTYNFRESMADPSQMVPASTAALLIVAGSYVVIGVGLYALFPTIDGDVLHTLPATGWLPILTRLSMTVVVFVTAPLLIVPCGQLIEGKVMKTHNIHDIPHGVRAVVRIGIALLCVSISVLVPGFVNVLSLVGCACVAAVGFVVPPLLYLQLSLMRQRSSWTWDLIGDVVMLVWGIVATAITTRYTFKTIISGESS